MKQTLKKYWMVICFALIINIPIICLGSIRTNKEILLKGDTSDITSFVDVNTSYEESGSFSSIYVIDVEHSTYLQNLLSNLDKTSTLDDINANYKHFSNYELYKMGIIQKNSSIMVATINAYERAKRDNPNIILDYSFKSFCVSFYFKGSKFEIGDEIIKINDIDYQMGRQALLDAIMDSKPNDIVTVKRDGIKKDIVLIDNILNECRWYSYFDIKNEEAKPSISYKKTNSGGPSGGLLQTLSIYNRLTEFDYTRGKKISGTGTINVDGSIGAIGGIKQKIYTAYEDGMEVFFCPKDNYIDAKAAYETISRKEKMALIMVETFEDAIRYLEND